MKIHTTLTLRAETRGYLVREADRLGISMSGLVEVMATERQIASPAVTASEPSTPHKEPSKQPKKPVTKPREPVEPSESTPEASQGDNGLKESMTDMIARVGKKA